MEKKKVDNNDIILDEFDINPEDIIDLNNLKKDVSAIIENNPIYIKKKLSDDEIKKQLDEINADAQFIMERLNKRTDNRDLDSKALNGIFKNKEVLNWSSLNDDELLKLTQEIKNDKSNDDMSFISNELKKLKMFGVYETEDDNVNVEYIDIIDNLNNDWNEISAKVFSKHCRIDKKYIPINKDDKILNKIIYHISNDFINIIKELSDKNKGNMFLKQDLIINENEINKKGEKLISKLISISNYIYHKNKVDDGIFILSSKKNIELIVKVFNYLNNNENKIYKYEIKNNLNFNLIVSEDIENTVIIGKCPDKIEINKAGHVKENIKGVNLFLKKDTLNNYDLCFDDEDIVGVNISYDFHLFGNHPEYNYFNFNLILE